MNKETKEAKERKDARFVLYGEAAFSIIPFVLMIVVLSRQRDFYAIFYNSDWSLAATILFGQALVRFNTGINRYRGRKYSEIASLWTILLLAFLMVSLVVYVLQLSEEPSIFFSIAQIFLFIVSLLVFVVFGAVGEKLLRH